MKSHIRRETPSKIVAQSKRKKSMILYSAYIQSVGPLKALYTFALPDRPVHSDTNSAYLGSILVMQQLRATTKSLTCPSLLLLRSCPSHNVFDLCEGSSIIADIEIWQGSRRARFYCEPQVLIYTAESTEGS